MNADPERAKSYFDDLAPEYDGAFSSGGRGLVNRFFRGRTFVLRMRRLEALFAELGLAGKTVLDLGCGSGQVSVLAARMGASVHAVDIAPQMLEIARRGAAAAGVADKLRFEEGDVSAAAYPPADVVLLIGVVEYYADLGGVIRKAGEATRGTLVVAHTTRVLYRMLLRRLLFAWRGAAALYFHPMPEVVAAAEAAGLRLARSVDEHAFSILIFERRG